MLSTQNNILENFSHNYSIFDNSQKFMKNKSARLFNFLKDNSFTSQNNLNLLTFIDN
jgi:hypothetical protein